LRSSIQDASFGPVNSGAFINLGVGDTIARSMAKGILLYTGYKITPTMFCGIAMFAW
jgi:hypothetical protein